MLSTIILFLALIFSLSFIYRLFSKFGQDRYYKDNPLVGLREALKVMAHEPSTMKFFPFLKLHAVVSIGLWCYFYYLSH